MKRMWFCLILMLGIFPVSVSAETVIIANKSVPNEILSQEEIREVFLGKMTQWEDNSSIRLVILKAREAHDRFLKQYVRRSLSQWNAHWRRMLFTGRGVLPTEFRSAEELVSYVAETKGAIGYADMTQVSDKKIKIITTR